MNRTLFAVLLSTLMLAMACSTDDRTEDTRVEDDIPVNRWSTDAAWQLLQAQDERNTSVLRQGLNDPVWQIRRAAALALASVQDSATTPALMRALQDSSGAVRAASAFALGLTGSADDAEDILDLLRFEHDPVARYAMWEAVGRTGDTLTLKRLLNTPMKMRFDSLGLAWGLCGMALNGYADQAAVDKCLELLLHPEKNVRLGAAHALSRSETALLRNRKEALGKWLDIEPVQEVRMALIRAFGRTADRNDLPALVKAYETGSLLERVNVLRVFRGRDDRMSHRFLQSALQDSAYQVSITAAQMLIARPDFDVTGVFDYSQESRFEEAQLMILAAQLRKHHTKSRLAALLKETFQDSNDPYIKAHAKAIALETSKLSPVTSWVAMAVADSSSAIEKTAATQALFSWFERHPELGHPELIALGELLNSTDPGVLADVATFIYSKEQFKGNDVAQLRVFAEYSMDQLDLPKDLEAKLLLQQAVNHLRGLPPAPHQAPPFNHPIDRKRLDALPNGQEYVLMTDRGEVRLRTFVDEAPGSCLAFDSLVSSGYYNDKAFHRVVPNFVAQGGCPRGDGYGSMDWTLRTEIGLSRYETGSIGLASAGPDTESCQFFITHSPAPHLDGHYTRFGQVTHGMDVVNGLMMGDIIRSIERVEHLTEHAQH
jgi:cyclophilin family peptidyl-prolyl cis-trans isomerase/HEAT repeat protein